MLIFQPPVNFYFCENYKAYKGVPQGSVLGPLFFSISINDIVNGLSSLKLLFADDFKLYREISTISDCVLLQDDLLKLSRWCHENKFVLNLNKCTVMSITHKINIIEFEYRINNVKLARVQSVVDLGITFDNKLSFVPHKRCRYKSISGTWLYCKVFHALQKY
jgi:hypothetical protein